MLPAVFPQSTAIQTRVDKDEVEACYIAFVLNTYKYENKETNCKRDDSNQFSFTSQSSLLTS